MATVWGAAPSVSRMALLLSVVCQPFCQPPALADTVTFALRMMASLRALVMVIIRSAPTDFTLWFATNAVYEGSAIVASMAAIITVTTISISVNPAIGLSISTTGRLRVLWVRDERRLFMISAYQQPATPGGMVVLVPMLSMLSVPHLSLT